jgi:hypothetical protein
MILFEEATAMSGRNKMVGFAHNDGLTCEDATVESSSTHDGLACQDGELATARHEFQEEKVPAFSI